MGFQYTVYTSELPSARSQTIRRSRSPKFTPIMVLTLLFLTLPFHLFFLRNPHKKLSRTDSNKRPACSVSSCDLFSGEWVPNPEGPYYTHTTCDTIQDHQNCMKFGRLDSEFLKWKWKPDGCELPVFDPREFLRLMTGKSLAFVGDSVARNHMQSLICLLSKVAVAHPLDSSDRTDQNNKVYKYEDYDFTLSILWAPYLVKTGKLDPTSNRPFDLYLDQPHDQWPAQIARFDYVIISASHWFFRPAYFHLDNRLVGCLYCSDPNVTQLTPAFSYRRAFRTAFRAAWGFKGVAFLSTFSPSHFEGGEWDRGGDCRRTAPFGRNGTTVMEEKFREMYSIQLEEAEIARRAGRGIGGRIKVLDVTRPMMLRPDGHPSRYGHLPNQKVTLFNDCVHWCLPGPIDTWNDFLMELLKREIFR